jgi:hypothetical protein
MTDLACVRRGELATELRHDLTNYNGPSICYGIMYAGAAYPLAITALLLAWFILQVLMNIGQMSPANFVELTIIPLYIAIYAVFVAGLGLIWTGVLSMITLPVVYLVVQSLKLHGNLIWLGAFAGGLVGFIAVLPFIMSLAWIAGPSELWHLLIAIPLGPGLATVFGQIGGAWGGWRASQNLASYYGVIATSNSTMAADVASEVLVEANRIAAATQEPRWQFGLRHMMWLIVWLSLLLSAIRLSGFPFEYAVPLIAGWSVYHWLTLRVGRRLVQWRRQKQRP